jgi:hypothetical protein
MRTESDLYVFLEHDALLKAPLKVRVFWDTLQLMVCYYS